MKNILKKVFVLFMLAILLTGCSLKKSAKFTIISTSFPGYDFARSITRGNSDIDIKMLVKPGAEVHDYDPSPQDIIDISNADIFIYVGGESDDWIESIIGVIDSKKTTVVKLTDLVETKDEEIVEGMQTSEEETEEDEHVWTSPKNAIKIINKLKDEIVKIDEKHTDLYRENADIYIKEIEEIDEKFREIVKNAKRKELIFGDRFPFKYFTDEYGLTYYAAFPGCSEETEASAKTVSFLINKVKKDKVPVVLHIEQSDRKIAESIASETGAKVLEFHSCHNVTRSEFDKNVTYVTLMKKNIDVLEEALN